MSLSFNMNYVSPKVGIFEIDKTPVTNNDSFYILDPTIGLYNIVDSDGSTLGTWTKCTSGSPQYQNGQCQWKIEKIPNSDNIFTIKNLFNGKYLTVNPGNIGPQMYNTSWTDSNPISTRGCQWVIEKTYVIANVSKMLYLHPSMSVVTQKVGNFKIDKIPVTNNDSFYILDRATGLYNIVDSDGSTLGTWTKCSSDSPQYQNGQCQWKIEKIPNSDNIFTIKNLFNGKYLTVSAPYHTGTQIYLTSWTDSISNDCQWRIDYLYK